MLHVMLTVKAGKIMRLMLFLLLSFLAGLAHASGDMLPPKQMHWQFDGMLGNVDVQSAQRGFQVYKEVCAACHSVNELSFRNLQDLGFTLAEVKEIAQNYTVKDGPNDDGEMFDRPGTTSDKFPLLYPNEKSARAAHNGAFPPDLSLIIKAREDGANYVYSLLTGFNQTPPSGMTLGSGLYYNPYFAGGHIAMAPPLVDGAVTYSDGTDASVANMARDVVNFLQWAAEPEMQKRKAMGIKVLSFLAIFTIIFSMATKKAWKKL